MTTLVPVNQFSCQIRVEKKFGKGQIEAKKIGFLKLLLLLLCPVGNRIIENIMI